MAAGGEGGGGGGYPEGRVWFADDTAENVEACGRRFGAAAVRTIFVDGATPPPLVLPPHHSHRATARHTHRHNLSGKHHAHRRQHPDQA